MVDATRAALERLTKAVEPFGRIPIALMDNARIDQRKGKTRYSFAYWAARPPAFVIDHKWVSELRAAHEQAEAALREQK